PRGRRKKWGGGSPRRTHSVFSNNPAQQELRPSGTPASTKVGTPVRPDQPCQHIQRQSANWRVVLFRSPRPARVPPPFGGGLTTPPRLCTHAAKNLSFQRFASQI